MAYSGGSNSSQDSRVDPNLVEADFREMDELQRQIDAGEVSRSLYNVGLSVDLEEALDTPFPAARSARSSPSRSSPVRPGPEDSYLQGYSHEGSNHFPRSSSEILSSSVGSLHPSQYSEDELFSHDLFTDRIDSLRTQLWLTHPQLCMLLEWSAMGRREHIAINRYIDNPSGRIRNELEAAFGGPYDRAAASESILARGPVPISGQPDEDPDVITGAIQRDCLECFELIYNRLPDMNCYECNRDGWSFLSLAIYYRSKTILRYLFGLNEPRGGTTSMMFLNASATQATSIKSPLALAAEHRDVDFLTYILDHWEPHLALDVLPSAVDTYLTPTDKFILCMYVTPELAIRLARFGVELQNVVFMGREHEGRTADSGATSWHAAAVNRNGLLRFIAENSSLSRADKDAIGRTPLDWAYEANNHDAILWLEALDGVSERRLMRDRPSENISIRQVLTDLDLAAREAELEDACNLN